MSEITGKLQVLAADRVSPLNPTTMPKVLPACIVQGRALSVTSKLNVIATEGEGVSKERRRSYELCEWLVAQHDLDRSADSRQGMQYVVHRGTGRSGTRLRCCADRRDHRGAQHRRDQT
ncbi:hypothetical protein ACFC4G_47720 [Streptomyces sp. NPDC056002]|uniref:hypothetical protein n=1 Tax=Streptomyces sp. NPDC056002 TaxID=3345675 RepID=UPI0035E0F7B3